MGCAVGWEVGMGRAVGWVVGMGHAVGWAVGMGRAVGWAVGRLGLEEILARAARQRRHHHHHVQGPRHSWSRSINAGRMSLKSILIDWGR